MTSLVLTAVLATSPLPLMPLPAEVTLEEGAFPLDGSFRVATKGPRDLRIERALPRFLSRLTSTTGIPLPDPTATATRALTLTVLHPQTGVPGAAMDESYTLLVTPSGATIEAPETWGALRGLETLLQLVRLGAEGFELPAVTIRDRPRFPWRGLLVDSARHFMPVPVLERTLDSMAAVKMNVLHWHLTEDQGFRVESRRHPRLHQMGSDGLFYTQDEIRHIIALAADRGIRVVPEFDMPGHTTSWFVGHPELASEPGPYAIVRTWGVFEPVMDPTREETYRFLDSFLGEMASLFPDEVLHVGGDEVEGHPWDRNPKIVAFKQANGMKTNVDLQAHFNRQVTRIVTAHGKTMMGWDEILHPDLPKTTIVHSWRGPEGLAKAARQGHRTVLSFGYYIDLMHSASDHYLNEPLAKDAAILEPHQQGLILGGEATMWSEFVGPETVDSRIWPRTAAIAERLWSPRGIADVEDMYRRLPAASRHLETAGALHRISRTRMLERLAGNRAEDLRLLSDLVEPLEGYERGATARYTSFTPLNRLVDATPPESDAARELLAAVERLFRDPNDPKEREEIRARLTLWRDLDARLAPVLEATPLLRETRPLSTEVSALAATGLEALAWIESGKRAPESWWSERSPLLTPTKRPVHALEVAFRPAIAQLMGAAHPPAIK